MNKKCVSCKKISLGFTLVELLVTLAIAAILLGVGIPSFTTLISSNNADSAARRLSNSLNYARSEAVNQFANITICASADMQTCPNDATWASGWIIHNSPDAVIADIEILRVEDISSLSVTFGGLGVDAANNTSVVRSVCFNDQGVVCDGVNWVEVDFTATANTNSSVLNLNVRGATNLE